MQAEYKDIRKVLNLEFDKISRRVRPVFSFYSPSEWTGPLEKGPNEKCGSMKTGPWENSSTLYNVRGELV